VFERFKTHGVLELQQRALEYGALPLQGEEMMEDVLREMPAWNTDRTSVRMLTGKRPAEARPAHHALP